MTKEEIQAAQRVLCLIQLELGKIAEALIEAETPSAGGGDDEALGEIFGDARDSAMQVEVSVGELWCTLNNAARERGVA